MTGQNHSKDERTLNWSRTAFPGRIPSEKAFGMQNAGKSYDILIKTQMGMPIRPFGTVSGYATIPAVDGLI
ncbi:hypothetical protein SBDP2_1880002 [Syntrophobacter sp. SbD2]|nr:hypothetical protein SBDP2_1880002 [Syntrophobacter sp. SbD2]